MTRAAVTLADSRADTPGRPVHPENLGEARLLKTPSLLSWRNARLLVKPAKAPSTFGIPAAFECSDSGHKRENSRLTLRASSTRLRT